MSFVFHGDCLEWLPTLAASSADMVLSDPPYFIDSMDSNWSAEEQIRRKSNSHIKALPSGMKFTKSQGVEFQKFMSKVAVELFRVIKPGGFCVMFSSPRMYHNLVSALEKSGFEIRDQLIWKYNLSQSKAFSQNHIIDRDKIMTLPQKAALKEKLKNFKTPQLKPLFEPMCLAMKPIEKRFIDNMRVHSTGLIYCRDGKTPTTIFEHNKPSKKEKTGNFHPTVKPLDLLNELLDVFCPTNGVVIDPFLGSGSTTVAAEKSGRTCLGSELNADYIKIIESRRKLVKSGQPDRP